MKPVNLFQNLNGRDINVHGTCCQKNFPYLNVRFTALEGRLFWKRMMHRWNCIMSCRSPDPMSMRLVRYKKIE